MSQSFINAETQWMGSDIYLRLYQTLANFNLLETYLNRAVENAEIAFKLSELAKHKWEQVADLFNSTSWVPKTMYIPSLHPDFDKVRELQPVSKKFSAADLFDRFQKAKTQMAALRAWCINDQTIKGKYTTALGVLRSSKQDEKFSSMSAFPSHLLYLWHYSDSFIAIKELFQLPLLIKPTPANEAAKKKSPFCIRESQGLLGTNAIHALEVAEAHHLELTENFGYVLSKLNSVNGDHYDKLSRVVEDLADRVGAAQRRIIELEKKILEG